jgi:hypothetical protein
MLINVLKALNLEGLSPQEKNRLVQRFTQRKKQLEEALSAVNQGLQMLTRRRKKTTRRKKR